MIKHNGREFKGVWIPAELWEMEKLGWNEKILLAEIDSFTSQNKDCFFSNEYLSEFLGVSQRMVKKYISKLKSLGLIEMVRFDGRKRFLRSLVSVRMGNDDVKQSSPQSDTSDIGVEGNQGSPLKGSLVHDGSEEQFTHTNTSTNSVTKKNNTITSEDFERFWAEVPAGRKIGKRKCASKLHTLIKNGEVDLKQAINGMKAYREYCESKRTETKYIKHPETWLNKGCWDDEYSEARPKPITETDLDIIEVDPDADDSWLEGGGG